MPTVQLSQGIDLFPIHWLNKLLEYNKKNGFLKCAASMFNLSSWDSMSIKKQNRSSGCLRVQRMNWLSMCLLRLIVFTAAFNSWFLLSLSDVPGTLLMPHKSHFLWSILGWSSLYRWTVQSTAILSSLTKLPSYYMVEMDSNPYILTLEPRVLKPHTPRRVDHIFHRMRCSLTWSTRFSSVL